MANSWKILSVAAFLDQVNWRNSQQLEFGADGATPIQDGPWQTETVEFFFQNCPWSGISRRRLAYQAPEAVFSLSLNVEEYFNCFAWVTPIAHSAPPVVSEKPKKVEIPESTEPSFTLNDLSNLF